MKSLFLITLFSACVSSLQAQKVAIDTIEYARSEAYKQNFKEADRLLIIYTNNNDNLDAMRLHAQVLYWMKDFDRSAGVFESMLRKFPNAIVVKLDYGRLLFEINKLDHAELLLNEYIKSDSLDPEANILLAEINYWKGHIKTAKEKIHVVLQQYPDNTNALAVLKDINSTTTPYLSAGYDYASDDQPLQKATLNAKFGWYRSWIFSPLIQAESYHFTLNGGSYNSSWVQAANKIFFGNSGFSINFNGGLFKHPDKTNTILTAGAGISQKIYKSLSFDAGTARIPYLYTATSVTIPVMQQLSAIAVNLDKSNKWLGKAAWQLQTFDDGNKIQTAYLWILIPVVDKNIFKLKAGYGFNYSNADKNTFTSSSSLNTLISNTTPGSSVPGYYNLYFTPNQQMVNSLLTSLDLKFSKHISFTTKANVGVFSTANNPELIFSHTTAGNNYSIKENYNKESYTPFDFRNELVIHVSPAVSINATYEYSHLLFYTINEGSLNLKYAFINEK